MRELENASSFNFSILSEKFLSAVDDLIRSVENLFMLQYISNRLSYIGNLNLLTVAIHSEIAPVMTPRINSIIVSPFIIIEV